MTTTEKHQVLKSASLSFILNPQNNFEKKVLQRSNVMGLDGAFYFTIGEFQSICNDHDDDFYNDDSVIEMIIGNYPSLEF